MVILGIDPGSTGAFALWHDGKLLDVRDMPTEIRETGKKKLRISADNDVTKVAETKTEVSAQGIWDICLEMDAITYLKGAETDVSHVFLEHVHGMPGQGNMFAFGRSYALCEMAVLAWGAPLTLVDPTRWKRAMGCTSDKNLSRQKATEMFPDMAHMFKRKSDDGRAEAALIAAWGAKSLGL